MMGYGDFGWMSGFGWLWMVLFLGALIALLVWGADTLFGTRDRAPQPAPLDILKWRYAAGEITQSEFEQAKRALT